MSTDLAAFIYLVSGLLFILALRELPNPETSRQGNYLGMTGMALAVVTTLTVVAASQPATWLTIFGFLALAMAAVNIFGGFLVTQRMLAMYKKKEKK